MGASWTTTQRPVLVTLSTIASTSIGHKLCKSISSAEIVVGQGVEGVEALEDAGTPTDDRHVVALLDHVGLAEVQQHVVGHLLAEAAVDALGLEEDDRVGIPDGGREQAGGGLLGRLGITTLRPGVWT